MKILVYGAGSMGSLYAALLQRSGQQVSVLARGARLAELRERGIQIEHATTADRASVRVDVVERLDPQDAYDLVLVVLPRHHVPEVLPTLAASRATPSVMFFGNNASGPGEMVDALGRDRVLLGFPGAAAIRHHDTIRYLITSAQEQPTTIGELDGSRSPRIEAIEGALRAAGFSTAICSHMDAWLKTHVVEISPTALALYAADSDAARLARTRDALLLMLRAIREGYRVLRAHAIPITPAIHRIFPWIPEPVLLAIMRRMVESDETSVKIGHAAAARTEMQTITDELGALAASASIPTPALDRLRAHLNPTVPPLPDGVAELSPRWGAVGGLALVLGAVIALAAISC